MRLALFFKLLLISTINLCGLSASYGSSSVAKVGGPGQQKLLGAEVELNYRRLVPFAADIDFSKLQERVLGHRAFLERLAEHRPNDVDGSYEMVRDITLDLPFQIPHFLDLVPVNVREMLVNGLQAELGSKPLAILHGKKIQVPQPPQIPNSPDLVPGNVRKVLVSGQPEKTGSESAIILPGNKIQVPEQSEADRIRSYWKTINTRWNQLPGAERLRSIPWSELPVSLKSKLLVYLYSLYTEKDNGPDTKGFRSNVLRLQFRTPSVERLFNEFYGARDGNGIVEFHTLDPKKIDVFFPELKDFLKFLGVERQTMLPGTTFRNDIGLHIHYSSPNLNSSTIKDFASNYKRMIVFRALSVGDYTVLIPPNSIEIGGKKLANQDYSYKPWPLARDVLGVSMDKMTIEVRYFVSDVEAEMRELDRVSEMTPSEVRAYTFKEIEKLLTPELVRVVLKSRPEVFFDLLPLDFLAESEILRSGNEILLKKIVDSIDYFPTAATALDQINLFLESGKEPTPQIEDFLERILLSVVRFPELQPDFYFQLTKMKARGFSFKGELSEYNEGGRAEEAFKTNFRESLASEKSLFLFRLIKASSKGPLMQMKFLRLLAEPGNMENIRNDRVDKEIREFLEWNRSTLGEAFVNNIEGIINQQGENGSNRTKTEVSTINSKLPGSACCLSNKSWG